MLTESWVEGKSVEEKDSQPTEITAALWGLSSKIDSRIWDNFTRNGVRLGSRHQEPPHTDVSRNLATVVVRRVLPGLRRRKTGLLPGGPKSSIQMRASFVFHLKTKVLESGGRVEKLIAQVDWSPTNDNIPDSAIQLHGLSCCRADRDSSLSGKTRRGSLCVCISTKNGVTMLRYYQNTVHRWWSLWLWNVDRSICRGSSRPLLLSRCTYPRVQMLRTRFVNCTAPSANNKQITPKLFHHSRRLQPH